MNEKLNDLLSVRLYSPNNVNAKLCDYLSDNGISITNGNRKTALIDGKRYAITFTSATNKFAECRQFGNEDGILTMHEKDGKIYLIEKEQMAIKNKTRELNGIEFSNFKAKISFDKLSPTNKIKQINKSDYVDAYMDIANDYAKKIVGGVANILGV